MWQSKSTLGLFCWRLYARNPNRRYLHLDEGNWYRVTGLAYLEDPESYAGGSVTTGRVYHVAPTRDFIYHLTDNISGSCPAYPNPLVISIGNYTLADLHRQYKKYIHKRPKHLL
jgi:hypothetical protein